MTSVGSAGRALQKLLFVTLMCVVAPALALGQGAPPRDDTQVWNETQLVVPLGSKVDLGILQVTRLGFNDGFRSDLRTGIGVQFKLNKYYSIQPTYLYQYVRAGEGRRGYAHRLYVDSNVEVPFEKLALTGRIRTERIVRHSRPDAWNFRFRLGVEVPVKVEDHEITLFANDEVYYDTGPRAWTRNRFIAGVSKSFNERFTADVFYLHQNDGFATPGNLKTFGTSFKIRLGRSN